MVNKMYFVIITNFITFKLVIFTSEYVAITYNLLKRCKSKKEGNKTFLLHIFYQFNRIKLPHMYNKITKLKRSLKNSKQFNTLHFCNL
jgi:hypothetical protein